MQVLILFSKIKRIGLRILPFLFISSLFITGCHKTETPPPEVRGGIVQTSYIATYPPSLISSFIGIIGVEINMDLQFSVNADRKSVV